MAARELRKIFAWLHNLPRKLDICLIEKHGTFPVFFESDHVMITRISLNIPGSNSDRFSAEAEHSNHAVKAKPKTTTILSMTADSTSSCLWKEWIKPCWQNFGQIFHDIYDTFIKCGGQFRAISKIKWIKGVSFCRNCGDASVGEYNRVI